MGILSAILHRGVTTDVLDLLEAQHKEVDELFEQLEKGGGNRSSLVHELANKLAAHATVEEKIFYPAVMAKDTSSMLHESVEEHLAIKRIVADLVQMRLDDASFKAKIKVLKEQVTHHAHKEEEKKLFPIVKAQFSSDERAALGNEVLVMFEELMASDPSRNVPAETAAAAPLPSA
ncbi:MAG TPA: hemerythrin domain-containing protein [Kofleriaceae bacterium]|jgi:hemerythrin superfamily protein